MKFLRFILLFLSIAFVSSAQQTSTSYTYYLPTTTGWHDLSNTAMQPNGVGGTGDTCPSNTFGGFGYSFDSGCANITAWSSMIVDQANRRVVLGPGGGHTDYSGNELYTLDIGPTTVFRRIGPPSQPGSVEALSNPVAPNARHSYGGLVYIEHLQALSVTGGCLAQASCQVSHGQWLLVLSSITPTCAPGSQSAAGCTPSWTEVDSTQTGTSLATIFSTDQPACDYWNTKLSNKANNKEYCFFPNAGAPNFLQIDYDLKVNTLFGNGLGGQDNHLGAGIDQLNGIFVFAGNGSFGGIDLVTGTAVSHAGSTGCSGLTGAAYPALAYDERNKQLIGYPGSGQSVYIINDTGGVGGTWTCTTETLGSATPPTGTTANGEGIFHRFAYVRLEDSFIYCPINLTQSGNAANQDCWSYKRQSAAPSGERSFAYRASGPGVTRATNFVPGDLIPFDGNVNHPSTIAADGFGNFSEGGTTLQTQDTTTVPATAAGGIGGALKMFAQAQANQNVAGDFQMCLGAAYGNAGFNNNVGCPVGFGPTANASQAPTYAGSTVYMQVRVRYDSGYLSRGATEGPDPNGGEGFKIFGIHGNNPDSTCSSVGQILQNVFFRGFPQGFQNCGSGANFEYSTDPNASSTTRLLENGDFNCQYNVFANCATFAANQWWTYYCKWTAAAYEASSIVFPNGHGDFDCWVAQGENQPMKHLWALPGWSFQFQNGSNDLYTRLSLTIYDSRLCSNTNYVQGTCSTYPSGNVWYSEMIVSSQPIPAPFGTYNGLPYPTATVAQSSNTNFFVSSSGKTTTLVGSHTWNSEQDTDTSPAGTSTLTALNYTQYINNLVSWNHNATILWHKDLPHYCVWAGGSNLDWTMGPFPWVRSSTPGATDGGNKWDLSTFNQAYFDRLRARAMQSEQSGLYTIVELFDGLGLSNNRCSTDGYPLTGANNINGIDDGGGTNSMTMTATNAITAIQEAYVKKVIDTVNDIPNVIYEPSEEAPTGSRTFWNPFMIDLVHFYEAGGKLPETGEVFAGKPLQHPVLYATTDTSSPNDAGLYSSSADAAAPASRTSPTSSCGSGTPACKVNINDSDHTYFGVWTDTQQNQRNYIWENATNGAGVIFMDPYVIFNAGGSRNVCASPTLNVCPAPLTTAGSYQMNIRNNMGYVNTYLNGKMNLTNDTPSPSLCSTGFCLANNVATGSEFLIYAPSGGTFTVNLSVQNGKQLNCQWLNTSTGATTSCGTYTPTSSTAQSFTTPFSGDSVLFLQQPAASGTPAVSLSPTSFAFGNQLIGTTSGAQSTTLTNTGTATLNITSVSLTGTNAGDFSISSNTCGSSLGAGLNCSVSVKFSPVAQGARSANLTFNTNAASSPDNVSLTGTGIQPIVSLNPSSIAFPNQVLTTTSSPATIVTLTNTGNATLNLTSIAISGTNASDFSIPGTGTTCPLGSGTLTASSSCTVAVAFSPGALGLRSATLIFTTSAASSPNNVPLSGTGVKSNTITGTGSLSGTGSIVVQP